MDLASDDRTTRADAGRLLLGTSLGAALAGIVASSCCVLPLVLAAAGLGGAALGVVPVLAAWRPWLIGAAVLALVAAWAVYLRRRRACRAGAACAEVSATDRRGIALIVITIVVLASLLWQPLIEPRLLLLVR